MTSDIQEKPNIGHLDKKKKSASLILNWHTLFQIGSYEEDKPERPSPHKILYAHPGVRVGPAGLRGARRLGQGADEPIRQPA